jgi:hypothetical protein
MSAVSQALSSGERKLYLLGWIAATEYGGGSEWTLNHDGCWSGSWAPSDSKDSTKVHGTKESAVAMAKAHKKRWGKYPTYVRSYAYETSSIENAEKFCVHPLQDYIPMKEFV